PDRWHTPPFPTRRSSDLDLLGLDAVAAEGVQVRHLRRAELGARCQRERHDAPQPLAAPALLRRTWRLRHAGVHRAAVGARRAVRDRKSTRLNSSHEWTSY